MKNSLREIEIAMQENWPEGVSDTSFTLLKVSRLQEKFKTQIETCVGEFQLQHADFSVLATLRRSPIPYCLSPTDLYKSMFFSSGGLTKVLGRLVDAGLIERLDNPEDKRSKLVKLNVKGKELVEVVLPVLQKRDNHLMSGLSSNELTQLSHLLDKALNHNEKL